MIKELEDCIKDLRRKGMREEDAYHVCVKKTGIKRGKNKNGKATWSKK